MSNVSEKTKKINLLQFEKELDDIIFNHIDTSQNWNKAHAKLDELLNETIGHIQSSINDEHINLESANTFWVIFLNLMSRLIYFHTLSYKEMKADTSELSMDNVLSLLTYAVKCLPNTKYEDNQLFLDEVKDTVAKFGGNVDEIDKIAEKNNQDPTSALISFKEYCQLFN